MVTNWVRKVRNDLGLTQKELQCKYLSKNVISNIESGRAVLDYKRAIKFEQRFNEIISGRNITNLGYAVTPELLLGIEKINVDGFISEIKNKNMVTNEDLKKINEYLTKVTKNDAIELILITVEILKKDIFKNINIIDDLIFRLINLNISKDILIEVYMDIIRICYITHYHKLVIKFSKVIESDVEILNNNDLKISFYYNLANAYFELGEVNESLELVNKLKNFNISKYELYIFTLEANIYFIKNELNTCEKINKKIFRQSEKNRDYNFMANSCSNLSELYLKKKMIKKSQNYMKKAIKYIDYAEDYYKYNVYYNNLVLNITFGNSTTILDSFTDAYMVANRLNDNEKEMKILELIFNYYKNRQDKKSIVEILEIIRNNNGEIKPKVLLDIICFINKDELIKSIIKGINY